MVYLTFDGRAHNVASDGCERCATAKVNVARQSGSRDDSLLPYSICKGECAIPLHLFKQEGLVAEASAQVVDGRCAIAERIRKDMRMRRSTRRTRGWKCARIEEGSRWREDRVLVPCRAGKWEVKAMSRVAAS